MNFLRQHLLLSILVFCTLQQLNAQTDLVKYQGNPILSPGSGYTIAGFPFFYLMETGDSLSCWFTAATGAATSDNTIGLGSSQDGLNFTISAAPVLTHGSGNDFDCQGVFGASVLFDGSSYKMWYNGYNTQPYYMGAMEVGLATSPDGANWTKYSNTPVLSVGSAGSWDASWAYQTTVLFEDGVYKMWYTGFNGTQVNIGYATSTDGISWVKDPANPIFPSSKAAFAGQNPRVLHTAAGYEMWFNVTNNTNNTIELAYTTSADGITWENEIVQVLLPGNPGEFDSKWVWHPMVIFKDDIYKMWYSGFNNSTYSVGFAADTSSIGISEQPLPASIQKPTIFTDAAKNLIIIDFMADVKGGKLQIYDASGKLVHFSLINNPKKEIHTINWKPGIYILKLTSGGQQVQKEFFIP